MGDVEALFAPGGRLASAFPGYEYRPQQVAMARAVSRAFHTSSHLVVEAGTGVGKSLAYLVPALLWASASRERVVVSTSTINLQEQLFHKDVPAVRHALGVGARAAILRGRSNYVCMRRLRLLLRDIEAGVVSGPRAAAAAALGEWAAGSPTGCRSDLGYEPDSEVWERVCSEPDACHRGFCPYSAGCFYSRARDQADSADLVVVNHHLLLADALIRSRGDPSDEASVVPTFSRCVVDEGHELVGSTRDVLAASISRAGVGRLVGTRTPALWSDTGVVARLGQVGAAADSLFDALERLVLEASGDAGRQADGTTLRLTEAARGSPEFSALAEGPAAALRGGLAGLGRSLSSLAESLAPPCEREESASRDDWLEVRSLARRVAEQQSVLDSVVFGPDQSSVCWVEVTRRWRRPRGSGASSLFAAMAGATRGPEDNVRLVSAPVDVSGQLRALMFDRLASVVMTSATLTVADSFAFSRKELGVPGDTPELCLGTPFNFRRCALLGVASDIPGPDEPGFYEEASRTLVSLLAATRGRTLVLFTSHESLRQVRLRVERQVAALGLRLLCQGDAPRYILGSEFLRDVNSVLLGTESFWQGVDVPGEALSCLVIVRLPFPVPTDPIVEARSETLAHEGLNPFTEFYLPAAIIKFKQGFGRLIRTADDRGAVVVLDRRLMQRRYGRAFLLSLPACTLICAPADRLATEVESWLGRGTLAAACPVDIEPE